MCAMKEGPSRNAECLGSHFGSPDRHGTAAAVAEIDVTPGTRYPSAVRGAGSGALLAA